MNASIRPTEILSGNPTGECIDSTHHTANVDTANVHHGIFALAMMAITSIRSRWTRWRSQPGYHKREIYFDTEWDDIGKDITNTHMFNGSEVETYTETYDTIYRPYNYDNAKRHSLTYQHSGPVKKLLKNPGWAEEIAYNTALDLQDEVWETTREYSFEPVISDARRLYKRRWDRDRDEEDTSAQMEICESSDGESVENIEPYKFTKLTEEIVSNLGNLESLKVCMHPTRLTQHLPVCAPGAAPFTIIAWLQDTGASFDLASRNALGADADKYAELLDFSVNLSTANCPLVVDKCINMNCRVLRENIKPLLLDNTPFAMSVGQRCMERGYDFLWFHGTAPYYIQPDGTLIEMTVINNAPYIFDNRSQVLPACSAPAMSVVQDNYVKVQSLLEKHSNLKQPQSPHAFCVTKINPLAKLPERGSDEAAGFDLSSVIDATVPARGSEIIPIGLKIKTPQGCYGRIAPRSGLAARMMIDTGGGVIDHDYTGEVKVILFNLGNVPLEVKAGDKIAQLILEKYSTAPCEVVEELDETGRGENGFGSTGMPNVEIDEDDQPLINLICPPCDVPDNEPDTPKRRMLQAIAKSVAHLMTHKPFNKYCPACRRGQAKKPPHRRKPRNAAMGKRPKKWGEQVTCDYFVTIRKSKGAKQERAGLIMLDRGTGMRGAFPKGGKSTLETIKGFQQFWGSHKSRPKQLYCDNAPELIEAAKFLSWMIDHSLVEDPQSNGIVERTVGDFKQRTRSALEQAGLFANQWPIAIVYMAMAFNIMIDDEGSSAWMKKFGEHFPGIQLPLGALIDFKPQNSKKGHTFEGAAIPGIFLGWEMGPGFRWTKRYVVADLKDFDALRLRDSQNKLEVQHTTSIVDPMSLPDGKIEFPIKAYYDKVVRSITNADQVAIDDALLSDISDTEPYHAPLRRDPEEENERAVQEILDLTDPALLDAVDLMNKEIREAEEADPDATPDEADEEYVPEENAPIEAEAEIAEAVQADQPEPEIDEPEVYDQEIPHLPPHKPGERAPNKDSKRPPICPTHYWEFLHNSGRKGDLAEKQKIVRYWDWLKQTREFANKALSAIQEMLLEPTGHETTGKHRKKLDAINRLLAEICCEEDSLLGKHAPAECEVVRVTAEDDLVSSKGFEKAMKATKHKNCCLWISIPCTGGCSWQRQNKFLKGHQKRMLKHKKLFDALFANVLKLCESVRENGGNIVLEWPDGNDYWKKPEVIAFIRKFNLEAVSFHGCALGLKSLAGIPMLKPWKIVTDCPEIVKAFTGCKCTKDHDHQTVRGEEAKRSANYTTVMAKKFHRAWAKHIGNKARGKVYPSTANTAATCIETPDAKPNLKFLCACCTVKPTKEQIEFSVERELTEKSYVSHESYDPDEIIPAMPCTKDVIRTHREKIKLPEHDHETFVDADPGNDSQSEPEAEEPTAEERKLIEMDVSDTLLLKQKIKAVHFAHKMAAVARQVPKKEQRSEAKAREALEKEFERLRAKQVWLEDQVSDAASIRRMARETNKKIHIGRIFEICVEKGSEFPLGHPDRKYKGRCVFQGNRVTDEHYMDAIFQNDGSAPVTMQAAKICDFYGLLPGNTIQQCDADQAYTQSKLGGDIKTWCEIPDERWPKDGSFEKRGLVKGVHKAVCPMDLSLYGHPDAGTYWERHCDAHLRTIGFEPIKNWLSAYWNQESKMFLIVYVDDFKMSGPADLMDKTWEKIRQGIATDKPSKAGKFLGCDHKEFKAPAEAFADTLPGYVTGIRVMPDGEAKPTFVTKADLKKQQSNISTETEKIEKKPPQHCRYMEYDMEDFFKSCVDRYIELAPKGTKLKKAETPFIDESVVTPGDFAHPNSEAREKALAEQEGAKDLGPIAIKCLMKVLYGARMARYDLLRPCNFLASKVTKWDKVCDRKLHRMMCYIQSTLEIRMIGKVGDYPGELFAALFSDADFAGCSETMRSTSGIFLKVSGPNTSFPIGGCSKKQTAVSHSTPEAEIIAAELGLRQEGLPALDLLDVILDRTVTIKFYEDNQATIRMLESGKNPTLRHLGRTHKVDLAWLFEAFKGERYDLRYCTTEEQAADIFTKHFSNPEKFAHACRMIGHISKKKLFTYTK